MSRKKLVPALAMTAGLAFAGCGSEEASVVQTALEKDVKSAHVSLKLDARQRGRSLGEFTMRGPYRSNGEGELPSFDWRIRVASPGEDTVAARVISTGENIFVRSEGKTYEVGEKAVDELMDDAQGRDGAAIDSIADLSALGLDLESWFPKTAGAPADASVGGVATRRVSGRLDVSVALEDIAELLKRPEVAEQLGGAGEVPQLTQEDIQAVDALVTDPRVSLDAGREDGKLRRMGAAFRFSDPTGGGNGKVAFTLRLTKVDQRVKIAAPRNAVPIEKLGGLSALPFAGGLATR